MQDDLHWATEHYAELELQYPDQFVIVWKKQVVAHGDDVDELLDRAATPHRPRGELVIVECPAS